MIYKLAIFALCTALMVVLISDNFKSGALLLTVAACVCLFQAGMDVFATIKDTLEVFSDVPDIDTSGITLILKTLAVAYATSFGSDICMDSGQKSIANALETVGKMIMLSMALPMLLGIYRSVADIIG